jgi:hypothetical protein
VYQKMAAFQYVVASQEFYVYIAYPLARDVADKYPSTSFLLYMPKGFSDTTKIIVKTEMQQREVY